MTEAKEEDRVLVDRLMQLYLHDFSAFDGRQLSDDGRFDYPWLDAYWSDDDRHAYVLRVDGRPAGFALVRLGDPTEMAEFFVVRSHRRSGVGASAAREVFASHHGDWRVSEVAGNPAAVAFWRSVIPVDFAEHVLDDGTTEQRFTIGAARTART